MRCVKESLVPTHSLSNVPKPTTVNATEQRHPGVEDLKTPEADHFAALSRALLDVQHMPEEETTN